MSGISAIYFLDKKGHPIIFRNYRGEVTQDISSNFQKKNPRNGRNEYEAFIHYK